MSDWVWATESQLATERRQWYKVNKTKTNTRRQGSLSLLPPVSIWTYCKSILMENMWPSLHKPPIRRKYCFYSTRANTSVCVARLISSFCCTTCLLYLAPTFTLSFRSTGLLVFARGERSRSPLRMNGTRIRKIYGYVDRWHRVSTFSLHVRSGCRCPLW